MVRCHCMLSRCLHIANEGSYPLEGIEYAYRAGKVEINGPIGVTSHITEGN